MLNNIQAKILLILFSATLGSSLKLLLLDEDGTPQDSTRIKRQNNACTLPNHPQNGKYRLLESTEYTPGSAVNEYSGIKLTCTNRNTFPQIWCLRGQWSRPFSDEELCDRPISSSTATVTRRQASAPNTENDCFLPRHPWSGKFTVTGFENDTYVPYSSAREHTSIDLTCSSSLVTESTLTRALCHKGEWYPPVVKLGGCISRTTTTQVPTSESITETSDRSSRDGCTLPSNHLHGVYEKSSDKKFDVIYLLCNSGYYPRHQSHFCSNGTWYPELFECIRTCPPVKKSETYTATCVRGSNVISCNEPLEGTEVHITCNVFFEYTVIRSVPKCEGGAWSHTVSPCVPECGKSRVPVQELLIGGQFSNRGEYPWLVGIYFANQSHICGGSIISRYFVLSAAHCFTTYNNTIRALNPIDKTQYLVAAGKHYRSLHDERDVHKQITGLKRIYIPQYYYGIVQNYRYDYAILAVKIPFTLSEYVQLVCIDWESKYETQDFKENNTAVVSGWGYTFEASSPSEELKKLQVYFKLRPSCDKFLPTEFSQRYFTEDKVCAGNLGQNVCSGDSGGGLYFEHDYVYYIRGIVSVSPRAKLGCSTKSYALYTNVSKYLDSITNVTQRSL